MSTEVKVRTLPDCDMCKAEGRAVIEKAHYDAATRRGPWAYLCDYHFGVHAYGLGIGRGQRLVVE
jgi:hypothetical protein